MRNFNWKSIAQLSVLFLLILFVTRIDKVLEYMGGKLWAAAFREHEEQSNELNSHWNVRINNPITDSVNQEEEKKEENNDSESLPTKISEEDLETTNNHQDTATTVKITTAKDFFAMMFDEQKQPSSKKIMRVILWHKGGAGGLCNRLQQYFGMLDFASTFPKERFRTPTQDVIVYAAIDAESSLQMKASLDLPHLYSRMSGLSNFQVGGNRSLSDVVVMFDWSHNDVERATRLFHVTVVETRPIAFQYEGRFGFSLAVALAALPPPPLRSTAVKQLAKFKQANGENLRMISVHRRIFGHDYLTNLAPFCFDPLMEKYEDNNNITFTPQLLGLIDKYVRKENLVDLIGSTPIGKNQTVEDTLQANKFAFLVTTDYGDAIGDSTFLHGDVKTLLIAHPLRGKNNWDSYMFIDMFAAILTNYSLGNPWSSCDRILAHLKSPLAELSRTSESFADLNEKIDKYVASHSPNEGNRMFPSSCYRGFFNAIYDLKLERSKLFANYDMGKSLWEKVITSVKTLKISSFNGGWVRKIIRSDDHNPAHFFY